MSTSAVVENAMIEIDKIERPVSDRQVTMSNSLARSAQGLNIGEKRLIALGLAKTDSVPIKALQLASNEGWKLKIGALEYAEEFGITPQTAYGQLKDASEKLWHRFIRVQTKGRRGLVEKKFRWVSSVAYADGDGYVELNFSPEVAPHLLGLRSHFTTYKLRYAAGFDSVYAWRLFELLQSWSDTGVYAPEIEEFADAVEAPASCRKDFKGMRVRIIEPAVAAIREKAQMLVEWEPKRSGGRRVTSLEFRFRPDPQQRLDV